VTEPEAATAAAAIAAALGPHLPLPLGSLCVWGDWFGKPLDNQHIAIAASHARDDLTIEFHHREVLVVRSPVGWRLDLDAPPRESRFVIRNAERVEWSWYFYGRPELPENWFTWQHWREGGRIRASTTAPSIAPMFAPSAGEPAVIFL
jgi:hypothetical protein